MGQCGNCEPPQPEQQHRVPGVGPVSVLIRPRLVLVASEHRVIPLVADMIGLQAVSIVQVLLSSMFVMSVPPLVAQSFPSAAMVILRLFDLLALVVVAGDALCADAPWGASASAASAIMDADTMCDSFMMVSAGMSG